MTLKIMTPTEFDQYVQNSIQEYAEYMVEQQEFPILSIALKAAEAEVLPYYQDMQAPEKTFAYHIMQDDIQIGTIVYSYLTEREPGQLIAFIDYLHIKPEYRRQGFAKKVMKRVEKRIKSDDLAVIDLNVMLYKTDAQALYSSLGYSYLCPKYLGPNPQEITRFDMRKILT